MDTNEEDAWLGLVFDADRLDAGAEQVGAYGRAWDHPLAGADSPRPETALWVGLTVADLAFRDGRIEDAYDALIAVYRRFVDKRIVVGHPVFHLRVGQCKWERAKPEARPQVALDDLARALIGAGPRIFEGEDAKYFDAITAVLRPPEGFASWDAARTEYEGASIHMLGFAMGPIAAWLRQRGLGPGAP